jgi:hypothetical protein
MRSIWKLFVIGALVSAGGGAAALSRASSQSPSVSSVPSVPTVPTVPTVSVPVRAPALCDVALGSSDLSADGLFWTVGEHTFRRSQFGFDSCVPALPEVNPDVFGQSKTFAGTDIDSVTGKQTLGLWLSDIDGTNKRLLVSHGDAIAVNDPTVSADGRSVYFTAEHPGHFELHRFNTTTSTLDTLLEEQRPVALPTSHDNGTASAVVAVRIGSCHDAAPTEVFVLQGESRISLHDVAPALAGRWLTPVGWRNENELVVLSRANGCADPGDLWIIRSPMTTPSLELIDTEVTGAVVQNELPADARSPITLNENFAAVS